MTAPAHRRPFYFPPSTCKSRAKNPWQIETAVRGGRQGAARCVADMPLFASQIMNGQTPFAEGQVRVVQDRAASSAELFATLFPWALVEPRALVLIGG